MVDVTDHQYIDTPEALAVLCTALRTRPYVAIDTEFLRERTYRPELCLVQVKHEELLACIDTIVIEDLSALSELLLDESVVKVFHAASQDLEIFYLLTKKVPAPLFDTQIAAPLLGYNEQIGYGNLVNEHLGVELAKSHTRADWTRRPLPDKQIEYALDDVIYLEALYVDMHAQLTQQHRLAWLQPEFAEQAKVEKYDQPAGERWKKIRNIQRYKGPTLSV
ncbi:MAG: ribonuclease D, partial [Pseudomonadales bacterium]